MRAERLDAHALVPTPQHRGVAHPEPAVDARAEPAPDREADVAGQTGQLFLERMEEIADAPPVRLGLGHAARVALQVRGEDDPRHGARLYWLSASSYQLPATSKTFEHEAGSR